MITKKADTNQPIAEIIANRWSGRAYDSSKVVSTSQIISLCEAARWSPSCYGEEPWRFIVCDKIKNKAAFNKALDCLVEWNTNWAKNTSVLLVCLTNTKFKKNGKTNDWAEYDAGAAAMNICLQAVDMGLMAHQIGGFDENKVRTKFDIPSDYKIMSMISVGYQTDESVLDEELKKLELKPRKRSSLVMNFFDGDIKKGISQ